MEDIQRCTELCAAILNEPDDRLVESVSAITAAFLDGAEGGYFPADTEVPGHLTLRVAPGNDPETFGWLAFTDTPQRARRLEALARLVADMLRQRVGRQRQEQMIEQIHDSIIAMDLTGFITDWNAGAERLFGYTAEEAIGRNVLFLYADEDEDDGLLQDHFLDHGGREIEVRRRRKSGEVFWASLSLSLVRDKRGFPMGLIGYLVDITPRIEAEQRLHLHASIFDSSEEGIMITDAQEHIVSVNPAFCRITGFIAAEVLGRPLSTFHSGRYDAPFYEEMWAAIHATGRWQGEVWGRRKSGEEFPQWASISAVRDSQGAVKHYFSIFSDITDRKRNEEQIHHLAYYDTLTTLPNRAHLLRLVGQALAAAQRNHARGAILFVDLNRFKPINDTLGHDAGDLLLIEIGRRFRGTLRQSDVVARIGGDEFVVALFDVVRHDNPGIVAQKLLTVLDLPFTIEGHELRVGASIGISLFPEDAQDTDTLLRYADIAMYRAKQTGDNGFIYYSQDMNQRSLDRIKTETGLRRALEQKE
ncbi:MAG TPA: PAS domain S-box protein, partial [Rhodocyclaceae bacterium]|nr:PAS domain S-box protein [Rhodocyclaceae bacterium]